MPGVKDGIKRIPDTSIDRQGFEESSKKEEKVAEKLDLPKSLPGSLQADKMDAFAMDEPEREMLKKHKAGISHMFIFYFNINDYVRAGEEYLVRRDYLTRLFSQRKNIIFYNISSGIGFADEKEGEKEFRKITGFKEKSSGPLASVMGAQALGLPKNGSSALPLLENYLKKAQNSVVIIEYAEKLCPTENGSSANQDDRVNTVTLQRWARDREIMENNNMVILLTNVLTGLHSDLRVQDSGIEAICVSRPDMEERKKYINYLGAEYSEEIKGLDISQVANITAGLSRMQIEDIFLQAHYEKTILSFELVKKKKEEIFNKEYEGILKIREPQYGMDTVGGLEKIKKKFAKIIQAIKEGNYRRVPIGVLFVGPPGTAKTVFAEAIAKEAGLNWVELGNIRDMWVGSSEQRREKAEMGIRSLVPNLVFVDEFDQAFGRRDEVSTDSGVGRRMMGDWLKFISDTSLRGKVFWIGATNRPDLVEEAMKRPGRFDEIIPFLYPQTTEERVLIFKAIQRKYDFETSVKDFSKIASQELYDIFGDEVESNGADIEKIFLRAFEIADDNGSEVVGKGDLRKALANHIPKHGNRVDQMTLAAIQDCSSREYLPENWKEILQKITGEKIEEPVEVSVKKKEARTYGRGRGSKVAQ